MEFTYDKNAIRKYKNSFLKGELLEKGVISEHIYQSWVPLPAVQRGRRTKSPVREANGIPKRPRYSGKLPVLPETIRIYLPDEI